MSTRSLNKVMLIGNLTRDPELRYTPSGTAVCSFGLATNRSWVPSDSSERREETEFHRIVVWNKLAELCSQLLTKGRKVYIEGRLQTRSWETAEGDKRQATEIVADDMMILDNRRSEGGAPMEERSEPAGTSDEGEDFSLDDLAADEPAEEAAPKKPAKKQAEPETAEELNSDDIPF